MEGKPTRWGIIGTGTVSNDFCLALRTLPQEQHQIAAVAARTLQKASSFAQKHGIHQVYGSQESMSGCPDIDVAYIGTIHPTHVPVSVKMLETGKNVLCEKPMALTLAGTKKVIELAQRKQLFLLEGIWSRFFPAYEQLRSELARGSIGTVCGMTACMGFACDRGIGLPKWLFTKELGGGAAKGFSCYPIQLACLVFGNEKPEKIHAHGSLDDAGFDLSVDIMLCYKGGRTAQLMASTSCNMKNNAVIYGTKGTLEIPSPFWCPTELKTPTRNYEYPLPTIAEPTVLVNSAGFVHQAEAVRNALLRGEKQTEQMSHADSLLIAEILDEVLLQLGVTYDAD